jgi:hypothetical protein
MEERFCYLTGFIQTKMKEIELAGVPEPNVTIKPAVKAKFLQLSITKFSGNLQDCC